MSTTTGPRARLIDHLRRTSPRADDSDFATATSHSFDPDRSALHSTPHLDYSQPPSSMSIELPRAAPRRAAHADADLDSDPAFPIADDSPYEVTATPPLRRAADAPRKPDAALRRPAAPRRAPDVPKSNDAARRAAPKPATAGDDDDSATATGTHNTLPDARHTRFSRRQQTPRQSATTHSFALPDLPNLTELVSGVRKDGTPIFPRSTKPRSRFSSAAYPHPPIARVPIPDDEKALYAALQLLQSRIDALEAQNAAEARRAHALEAALTDLRARRRPAAPDDAPARLRARLDRADRKASSAEIATHRVVRERDALVHQIGLAYHSVEELRAENDALAHDVQALQAENAALKQEMHAENAALKNDVRALRTQLHPLPPRKLPDHPTYADVNAQIIAAVKRARVQAREDVAAAADDASRRVDVRAPNQTAHGLNAAVADEDAHDDGDGDADSTTDLDFALLRATALASPVKSDRPASPAPPASPTKSLPSRRAASASAADDTADLTNLSWDDPDKIAALRRALEAQHADRRAGRAVSAPVLKDSLPRKSSFKLLADDPAGPAKSVRLQSPPADAADVPSNTSRRRRTASADASSAPHVPASCTACTPSAAIPSPVRVSRRSIADHEDATLRPARPPRAALAAVLKALEDDVVHAKMELEERQRRYVAHDAAVGRRGRLELREGVVEGLRRVERGSEAVYAAFDVLEGLGGGE